MLDSGGGQFTRTSPRRILALSGDSSAFIPGDTYLLYLQWLDRRGTFGLSVGCYAVFDITGPKVRALKRHTDVSQRVDTMEFAEAVQLLRNTALAVTAK